MIAANIHVFSMNPVGNSISLGQANAITVELFLPPAALLALVGFLLRRRRTVDSHPLESPNQRISGGGH